MVRFRFCHSSPSLSTSISYKKHDSQMDPNIQINMTCSMDTPDRQTRHFVCTEEWSDFIHMGQVNSSSIIEYSRKYGKDEAFLFLVRLSFSVYIKEASSTCSILYNDITFTDFRLDPESGSGVPVHKSVMAAHSEVFKTMLNGEWKETTRDCLEVKGATHKTLQHLKDYMYLGSLPDDLDLCPLVLIAKRYMMHHLEEACAEKLARTVKAENLLDLVKLATDNGLYKLVVAILQNTSDEDIDASATKAAEVETINN